MKKKLLTVLAIGVLMFGLLTTSSAIAITLTFDDVTTQNIVYPLRDYEPNYGGLTWNRYWGVVRGSFWGSGYETGSEVRQGIDRWIKYYNEQRPHSKLDDKTPDEAYW
ncbi:MAG: transposase [Chloroflexi bacterium]|nr:transposase [Chloroflexota bacterium]